MLDIHKRTWAEVGVSAINYNYGRIRKLVSDNCKICGVVKANAYGHGLVEVSKMLQAYGCDYLAVACLDEAELLREKGIKLPILILGHTFPDFIERVVDCDAIQSLFSLETAKEYSNLLEKAGKSLKVHVKLETGMGRLGFDVKHGVDDICRAISLPAIQAEGVFTHFAVSDEPDGGEYTKKQFEGFMSAVSEIEEKTKKPFAIKHCANSGAILNHPEMWLDMVRPGILLYGCYPRERSEVLPITHSMEFKTRVSQIFDLEPGESISYGRDFIADKKMKVAVLPVGYGDGLRRSLSGKIDVIVNDRRCPQIGRICMDSCMVDVTDCETVEVGTIAAIFGHERRTVIKVEELAEKAGTNTYEILCGISSRIPRHYCK